VVLPELQNPAVHAVQFLEASPNPAAHKEQALLLLDPRCRVVYSTAAMAIRQQASG